MMRAVIFKRRARALPMWEEKPLYFLKAQDDSDDSYFQESDRVEQLHPATLPALLVVPLFHSN